MCLSTARLFISLMSVVCASIYPWALAVLSNLCYACAYMGSANVCRRQENELECDCMRASTSYSATHTSIYALVVRLCTFKGTPIMVVHIPSFVTDLHKYHNRIWLNHKEKRCKQISSYR
jgi:hypothetical protein